MPSFPLRATLATAALLLPGGAALAQAADAPALPAQGAPLPAETAATRSSGMPRLDIGVTTGFNNPGGIYGAEVDFRLFNRLSLGLAAGSGAWGPRLTPQVRLYPFGVDTAGLFLEGGAALNLGGTATAESNGQVVQEADMAFTPVVNASLGYRFSWGRNAWSALRVGYGFRLNNEQAYTLRGGATLVDPLMETLLEASEPGGFLVGLSAGFSIL